MHAPPKLWWSWRRKETISRKKETKQTNKETLAIIVVPLAPKAIAYIAIIAYNEQSQLQYKAGDIIRARLTKAVS